MTRGPIVHLAHAIRGVVPRGFANLRGCPRNKKYITRNFQWLGASKLKILSGLRAKPLVVQGVEGEEEAAPARVFLQRKQKPNLREKRGKSVFVIF